MVKLKDIYQKAPYSGYITVVNIDTMFLSLIDKNIEEVEISKKEMVIIVFYFIANVGNTELAAEVLRNNKLDKFFGINLILK